jgi:hypothetical protein
VVALRSVGTNHWPFVASSRPSSTSWATSGPLAAQRVEAVARPRTVEVAAVVRKPNRSASRCQVFRTDGWMHSALESGERVAREINEAG